MKKLMALVLIVIGLIVFMGCTNATTTLTGTTETTLEGTTNSPTTTESGTTTEVITLTTETTTSNQTTTEQEVEPVALSVSSTKPYIFVNVNEAMSLSDYAFRTVDGLLSLADVTISNETESITFADGTFTVTAEGTQMFDITSGEEVLTIYVFAKAAEATDYLVYSMSFTDLPNGPLPEGYTIETMGLGSTGISNGYLYVDSPDIGDPTRVLLPEFLKGFKNYIIETDFTIKTAMDDTRWGSVMYRFSTSNYFQMCIRQDATANNGVEFAKAVNGSWNVPMTVAYSEKISAESIYRVKVDLFGATAKEYINDELLITYEGARDFSNGYVGLQSSGAKALFNNIEIRIPESYIDYTTIEYQNLPTVYTPDTDIIMAPTVVQTIETQADVDMLAGEVRPATALFDINASLDAINDSSQTLLSFIDILEATKGKTIPAFRTSLPFVAHNLAVKLEEYGVKDVFIISSNAAVIERARGDYNLIRGVLQIDYDSDNPILSDADLLEIRNQTNSSGSVAVMLPIEYATRYNVEYFQKRLLNVWVNTVNLDDHDIIKGIVSGANGVVCEDASNVYTIFDIFPENTMLTLPLIVGHRGMPSMAPENTSEGMLLALAAGADIVELDIYLTTDNEIVVMHDRTTERTTDGNLVVEESTLAQLRELTIIDDFGTFPGIPVPTLEEYFQKAKGTGLLLFIEIKSSNPEIVTALKLLIDEYDFYDQAMVITFNVAQTQMMREVLPELSVGLLNSNLVKADNLSSSLSATLNQIVPLKTTLNPNYATVTAEFLVEMQHRGISVYPWTINNPTIFLEQFVFGAAGITTDHSYWISDEYVKFWTNQTEFVYSISNPTTVEVMTNFGTKTGFEYPFPGTLQVVSGSETGITFGARNAITGATSTGDVYILPSFTTTLSNGATIVLYADVIHVQIVE
ncbi:MAG: hypothetical protein JEZ05_07930 [Tenericutes bacterium]|nr:hypothetical protein [Mycoplasmatota bacterium]